MTKHKNFLQHQKFDNYKEREKNSKIPNWNFQRNVIMKGIPVWISKCLVKFQKKKISSCHFSTGFKWFSCSNLKIQIIHKEKHKSVERSVKISLASWGMLCEKSIGICQLEKNLDQKTLIICNMVATNWGIGGPKRIFFVKWISKREQ